MNKLYFFTLTGLRSRRKFWLFCAAVAAVAVLCFVNSPAPARAFDDDDDGACTLTVQAAYTACQSEVEDNYWIARGKCNNLSNRMARTRCVKDAGTARRNQRRDCAVFRDRRQQDFCQTMGEAPYDPQINPANFVDPARIGTTVAPNPYFLLLPGREMVYREGNEEIRVMVTNETRVIAGVTTRVVHDEVKVDGETIEDTIDWYAQDVQGNVWYFGEITEKLEDGILVNIDGSWTTGVNGDKPGFAMKRFPIPGETYRQEFSLNNAEDGAKVLTLTGSATVPAASCNGNCLITKDFSPIIPDLLENKYFAPGVGFILEVKPLTGERLQLVQIIQH